MPPHLLEREAFKRGQQVDADRLVAKLNKPPRLNEIFSCQPQRAKAEFSERSNDVLTVRDGRFNQDVQILGIAGPHVEGQGVRSNDAGADAVLMEQS